jgi:hypothetical protein
MQQNVFFQLQMALLPPHLKTVRRTEGRLKSF